jgi:hypothetical protein
MNDGAARDAAQVVMAGERHACAPPHVTPEEIHA